MVTKPSRTISAAQFKAKCLAIMDEVAETREPVVITKRGKPVAELRPLVEKPTTLFGFMKGRVQSIEGVDLDEPVDVEWEAMR
jgi:prevent-host-death family protein